MATAHRTRRVTRLTLYTLAALGAIATVIGLAFSLLDWTASDTTISARSYDDVTALTVSSNADVRLTGAPADARLRVRTINRQGLFERGTRARLENGELRLDGNCRTFRFGSNQCQVGYEVAVPAGTALNVRVKSGDLIAQGLQSRSAITLQTGSGAIKVDGASTPSLRLSSGSGDLRATRVRGRRVSASTGTGSIALALHSVPNDVTAKSSTGGIELVVPDSVYQITLSTSIGSTDASGVRNDPASPRLIRATTEIGDVRIVSSR